MKRALFILLAVLAGYVLTAGGHLYSPDEELVFRTTRALATGHGLAIEPLGGFATRRPDPPRPDGREYAQYGVMQPVLAVPLYWIGEGLGHLGGDAFWQRATGGHYPGLPPGEVAPRWACSWFNVLLAPWLALLVAALARELGADARAATLCALLYAFGTLAWPHSRPFFTEELATFFILFAWWGVMRALRGNALPWCGLAGAAAGAAFLTRMDSALAYPALAVLMLGPLVAAARLQRRPVVLAWLAFAAPALACLGVWLALNWSHFGAPLATGYSDQPEGVHFNSPLVPGLYGLLFSAGKGLFFFSPVLILSFAGWRPLAGVLLGAPAEPVRRQHWAIWAALMTAVILPILVQACWPNWAGGWCWGPRHIFVVHPFLALPIAALLTGCWNAATRIAIVAFAFVGVLVQLIGCSQDFIGFYNRFFRSPGQPGQALVRYDAYDEAFWSAYYLVQFRQAEAAPWRPVSMRAIPAPTQASIFEPALSVWAGYPAMLRDGELDNFWLNLIRDAHSPALKEPPAP